MDRDVAVAAAAQGVREVLDADEVQEVLRETFFQPRPEEAPSARRRGRKRGRSARPPAPRPEHYEVICISLYKEDLARLDAMVAALKRTGHRKMSRSGLIRFALDQVDVAKLPRAY